MYSGSRSTISDVNFCTGVLFLIVSIFPIKKSLDSCARCFGDEYDGKTTSFVLPRRPLVMLERPL